MAIASRLLGSGIAPQAATNIVGDVEIGKTATGTSSQANAYAISAISTEFTTVAANSGARLPAGTSPGDELFVYNGGANALSVYGATGESIQNGAANAAFSVAANKGALLKKVSTTRWMAILSA